MMTSLEGLAPERVIRPGDFREALSHSVAPSKTA
jgi:hypothetical protein